LQSVDILDQFGLAGKDHAIRVKNGGTLEDLNTISKLGAMIIGLV
jgi:hypothetical protein